jgi:hypothetical protein
MFRHLGAFLRELLEQRCTSRSANYKYFFLKTWLVRLSVHLFYWYRQTLIKWVTVLFSCYWQKIFLQCREKHFFVFQPHITAINMKEERQIFSLSNVFTFFGCIFLLKTANLGLLWHSCHWLYSLLRNTYVNRWNLNFKYVTFCCQCLNLWQSMKHQDESKFPSLDLFHEILWFELQIYSG